MSDSRTEELYIANCFSTTDTCSKAATKHEAVARIIHSALLKEMHCGSNLLTQSTQQHEQCCQKTETVLLYHISEKDQSQFTAHWTHHYKYII